MIPPADAEHKKPLILVVEDEADMRQNLKELLSEEFRVLTAADGKEALRIYYNEQFRLNVVLLDIRLPDLSGLEVITKMKNINLNPDIIMLTALSDIKTAVEAMRKGAYDYVNKPFFTGDLIAAIKRALEKRDYSRKLKELTDRLEHERIVSEHRRALFQELQMKGRVEGHDLSAEEKTLFNFPVLLEEDYNLEKLREKLEEELKAKIEVGEGAQILVAGKDDKLLELAKGRYAVEQASSEKEIFDLLSKKKFELIFLGLDIPGADSIILLSRIRKDYPDTDIILLAPAEDLDIAVSAMKLGAYDYLSLPLDPEDVNASIKRVFDKRGAKDVLEKLVEKYKEVRLSFEPRLNLFKQFFRKRRAEKKNIRMQDFHTFFPELKKEAHGMEVKVDFPDFDDEAKLESFIRRMAERTGK